MTTANHRHAVASEGEEFTYVCQCPGCSAAFSAHLDICRCGAMRLICHGAGSASLMHHVARGYSRWGADDDKEG